MIAITTGTCPAIRKRNDYDQGLVISISEQLVSWKLNTLLCFVRLQVIYLSIWKYLLISYLEKWPSWIKVFDNEGDLKRKAMFLNVPKKQTFLNRHERTQSWPIFWMYVPSCLTYKTIDGYCIYLMYEYRKFNYSRIQRAQRHLVFCLPSN